MNDLQELLKFFDSNPHISPKSNEEYASQILSMDKKSKKDILYLLDFGGFGDLDHLLNLVLLFRSERIKIRKITKSQLESYCKKEITAEEIILKIHSAAIQSLVPTYHDPPCKINPKAAKELRKKD